MRVIAAFLAVSLNAGCGASSSLDAGLAVVTTPDSGNTSSSPCGVSQPCEKFLGVCAGSARACVDGGFESVCTQLSYGPDYAEEDIVCDGLDNDCDGTVDENSPVWAGLGPTIFPNALVRVAPDRIFAVPIHTKPLVLDLRGTKLRDPVAGQLVTGWGPSGGAVAIPWNGGARVLQNSHTTVFAIDYDGLGSPLSTTADGGINGSLVAPGEDVDSGSFEAAPPSKPLVLEGGAVLYPYTLSVITSARGRVAATLRSVDGGFEKEILLTESFAAGSHWVRVDGGFAAAFREWPDGGGLGVRVVTFDSAFSPVASVRLDSSAELLPLEWLTEFDPPQLGLETTDQQYVVNPKDGGDAWYYVASAKRWNALGDGSTSSWLAPTVGLFAQTVVADDPHYLVGLRFDEPYPRYGPQQGRMALTVVRPDGGWSEISQGVVGLGGGLPTAIRVDDRTGLALWVNDGDAGVGLYSVLYCR